MNTKIMKNPCVMSNKRSYSARKYINNGIINMICFYIANALFQCSNIVIYSFRGTDLWHFHLKASCIIVNKFLITIT